MKIKNLTEWMVFPAFTCAVFLSQSNLHSQVSVLPLEDQTKAKPIKTEPTENQTTPSARKKKPAAPFALFIKLPGKKRTIKLAKQKVKPQADLPPIKPDTRKRTTANPALTPTASIKPPQEVKEKVALPPIKPDTRKRTAANPALTPTASIKPPQVVKEKVALPPIKPDTPKDKKIIPRQLAKSPTNPLPAIVPFQKLSAATDESRPPIKNWNPPRQVRTTPEKHAKHETKAARATEEKQVQPQPTLVESPLSAEIDASKKMAISVPKSPLKRRMPYLFRQRPGETQATDTSARATASSDHSRSSRIPTRPGLAGKTILETTRNAVFRSAKKQDIPPVVKSSPSTPDTHASKTVPVVPMPLSLALKNQPGSGSKPLKNQRTKKVIKKQTTQLPSSQQVKRRKSESTPNTWPSQNWQRNRSPVTPATQPRKLAKTVPADLTQPVSKSRSIMPEIPMTSPIEMINYVDEDNNSTPSIMLPRSPQAVFRSEAIFMTRESGDFKMSNDLCVHPFEVEMGIRINAQRQRGVDGINFTYAGIQEWNDVDRAHSASNSLGITPIGLGLPAGALSPFAGANFQEQFHRGNLHTLELNKVTWGWDVLNLFWGFRFTHYEEELSFFSSRSDGQQGLLDLDFKNNLFGPQVGGELFYDTGGIFSSGFKAKLGLMANAFEGQTQLFSNGTRHLDNSDSDLNFNFMAELGVFGRMRLGPQAFLRCGYEVWYNSAVFGANDNLPGVITPVYGQLSLDSDLFIHGGTAGFEIIW